MYLYFIILENKDDHVRLRGYKSYPHLSPEKIYVLIASGVS